MRWLWIDRFLKFESRKSARALKNLSLAEDYFADHFPGYPVMPAALILEGLAQTGGILVGEGNDYQEKVTSAGGLIAEAEIFFAHLDQSRSKQLFGDHNFVFSGELKYLLGLAKV